jgi:threonine/homoserine/homoserine lactone efflux protein
MAAAITGSAALLQASGVAFEIFKLLGVAYLLNMAGPPGATRRRWWWRPPCGALELAGDRFGCPGQSAQSEADALPPRVPASVHARALRSPAGGHADVSVVFMAIPPIVFVGYGVVAAGARRYVIEPPVIVRSLRRTFALSFVALSAKLALETR